MYTCVVFTSNRSFYPTTSVHPVSVLILHPREIQIMWSQTERKNKTTAINQGNKASEKLAYLVREYNKTSQTRKIRKTRTKKTKKADRSSEECDVRKSERLQEHTC